IHKGLVTQGKAKRNCRVIGFVREIDATKQSGYGEDQNESYDANAAEPFGKRTFVQRNDRRFLRARHGRKNGSVVRGDKRSLFWECLRHLKLSTAGTVTN